MSEPASIAPGRSGAEVAEFQGLYGAYHVSETLLQKVWLRREFDLSRARLASGEALQVLHPGVWNRLAGPDFRGAKLAIAERTVTGDIEVHFHAEAWTQHGHHLDPAYDNVVLHVVLFPPSREAAPIRTCSGRAIPLLVLVDLLWHDLEEYASDDAVAALSGRDAFPLLEELLEKPETERSVLTRDAAARRWREKLYFARRRVERLGWEEACHLTTLEILGYRANRVAMLRVGERFPWALWRRDPPTLGNLVALAADWWSLRGVRPANQPRLRLAQYHAWMQSVPDWPARVQAWGLPDVPTAVSELEPAELRRKASLPRIRRAIARDLCGGELGGTRLDTWICNLLLPFRALAGDEDATRAGNLWNAWYPGDAPESLLKATRQLEMARANGVVQGLLGLQITRAARLLDAKPAQSAG